MSASDRSPAHQSSEQVELSISASGGLNDAESNHMITHQPQSQSAGSSANQQPTEKDATSPSYVLISRPDSVLKSQHQVSNVSSAAPLHLVAFPVPYSRSLDVFCQTQPNSLSNMDYPLAPVLVPLSYTGSNQSLIPSYLTQQTFNTSPGVTCLPARVPTFPGARSVCTQRPASCLPVLSVVPAQELYLSRGSESSFAQNKAPVDPSELVHRPDDSQIPAAEPPSCHQPTAERYIEFGVWKLMLLP